MEESLTIYFVRHGETYFNKNQRTQGWCDPLLTPEGEKEVRAIGRELSKVKFDAAIVSDLKRTQTTAELILSESIYPTWLVPIKQMTEFREISFGSFEGMESQETWEILRKHLGFATIKEMLEGTTEKERLQALHPADPLGQGEDYQDYCQHLYDGMDKLLADFGHTSAVLLFIGHSINIRHLLQYLIPKEDHMDAFYDMYSMKNAGVIIIKKEHGKFKVKRYIDKIFKF